jgi:carboxypeptidase Q
MRNHRSENCVLRIGNCALARTFVHLSPMKKHLTLFVVLVAGIFIVSAFKDKPTQVTVSSKDSDSLAISKIFDEVLVNGMAYDNLRTLTTKAPKRLSGSVGAQTAVDVMFNIMKNMGLDSVWLQECMVPHWERGTPEKGEMLVDGTWSHINICALGGSVPTPSDGLTAEVIEVTDFKQLEELGKKKIAGKIVFFSHPFDQKKVSMFDAYGEAVGFRWAGPHMAETYGAVGVVVRSMSSSLDTFPHTGVMRTDSLMAKIPSAAISTVDAEELQRQLAAGRQVKLRMTMNCHWYEDNKSYNVIGEIRGSEHPEEVIVFGGHLDAWELGDGAHDDGTGCVQSVEVLRAFKALNIKPKHTIRAVMFMNEENGGRGGDAYAKYAEDNKVKHIAALESDAGGFTPRGFGVTGTPEQKTKVMSWTPLFFRYGFYDFTSGGGGSDIEDLHKSGTPLFGLEPDSQRYFDYHHTEIDTFDKVNKRELHMGAGGMAALVYLIDKYGL